MNSADYATFNATLREDFGTGESRRLRRDKKLVPCVIYVRHESGPPTAVGISICASELAREYARKDIIGRLFNIVIDKKQKLVVLYDLSFHGVSDAIEHVEFYEVPQKGLMLAKVPVIFYNHATCLPVKRGAFLNVLRRTITLECELKNYSEKIRINLADAALGQSYKVKDLPLPGNCKLRNCDSNTLVAKFMGKKASAAGAATAQQQESATQ